jgi:DNA primase
VIFTFDGDAAGRRAALRAFEMEEQFATQTFVTVQADGLDPCDLRVKHGDAAVRDLVASRVPLYEFAIRSALSEYDLATAEGRVHGLDAAARFIARIKDDALRKVYAYNVDRWLGLNDQDLVLARISQQLRGGRAGGSAAGGARARQARQKAVPEPQEARGGVAAQRYDPADPVANLERQALKLAVQHPALCGPVFDSLGADDFAIPAHSAVRLLIADCGGVTSAESVREWAARLSERALDHGLRDFIIRLAVEPIEVPRADGEPDARFAAEVLARVEELAVTRRIVTLKSRLQRMNPVDEAGYNRLFGDLIALEQRRKALVEKAAGAL